MVVTGKLFWKKLSDDQRELISQAMKEATEYGNKLAQEMDERYLAEIKAAGTTTVHDLTPEQRKAWKDKLMTIYPEFYDVVGKELIDGALNSGK